MKLGHVESHTEQLGFDIRRIRVGRLLIFQGGKYKLATKIERIKIKLLKGAHCDCRSCVHRSWWKRTPAGDDRREGWDCRAKQIRFTMLRGRWLSEGVFSPACGLRSYQTSFLKYLAYRLYCRFVFDEVLVARALRRLDGHLD